MADLTFAQRFSSLASIDETEANNPKLVIPLTALQDTGNGSGEIQNGLGLNDATVITDANKDSYAAKILQGLIMLSFQNQAENNNDETVSIYVINRGKRAVTRNSVAQFGYELGVISYTSDTLGTTIDLDDVGA